MKKNKIITLVLIAMIICVLVVGCNKTPEENEIDSIDVTSIEIDRDREILIVDGTTVFETTIAPEDATNATILWSTSYDEILQITEEGNITALAPGIATITASIEGSDLSVNATVYVGNAVVNSEYSEDTQDYGDTRFSTVASAISGVEDNGVIIIEEGIYEEDLSINKSIRIIGLDYPQLGSIDMTQDESVLNIRGVDFVNTTFPSAGEATIKGAIDGELIIIDCKFNINNELEREGGYAIYASAGSSKLTIKSSTIDNYRYGIYSHRAGANFDITNNTFTNLEIGVGIDIRIPNSNPAANYPAMGEINDNTFVDVTTRSEFFYNGEAYDGNLDFADFTPLEIE